MSFRFAPPVIYECDGGCGHSTPDYMDRIPTGWTEQLEVRLGADPNTDRLAHYCPRPECQERAKQ